jgi:hypothetical protein
MNCKPGDLAILIHANLPENLGAIVEVIRPCEIFGPGYWVCSSTTPRRGVIGNRVISAKAENSAHDSWLRPVSGLPIDDEVTEDLKEPT